MLFMKNYFLLMLLSITFLYFGLSSDATRLVSHELHSNREDGSKGVKISSVSKTMKTKYGDIIDCVDINKQPALDHPLLKNHIIQKRPNFPNGWMKGSSIAQVTDLKHLGFHQECPYGTVPIRRNTNNGSPSFLEPLGETLSDNNETKRVKMSAVVHVVKKDTRYIAARAQIDIQNPKCKPGETSSAFVWLLDGTTLQDFNMLLAGWTVNPKLYGDGNTRLSTFWADRIYNTGCYDFLCPGFVQIDTAVPLGTVLPNISVSGGPKHHITINIFQDQETKHWWLHFGETNTPIGYWPSEIFSHFANAASRIDLGGFVEGFTGQPNPDMGSGILPDGTSNYNYVSYYSHIEYISQDNVTGTPQEQDIKIWHDDAYNVEFHSSTPGKGANFLYGGPNRLKIVKPQSDDVVEDM